MQSLQQRDKQHIWHPFTPLVSSPDPIPIVKGEGAYLVDEAGHRYIDAISSWWVNLHGHGHPYIAECIYKQALQLEQVIFAGFTHRPAIELAERLLPLLPGNFAKVFYSDNGSTATEVAIKMALQYWWNQDAGNGIRKRTNIIAFRDGYHGDTFGAMSISDRSVFTRAFNEKLFDVYFIDTPDAANIATLENTIDKIGSQVAAFIYEPLLQGAGGMKMHAPEYLDRILNACKRNDIVCIADEVMTGFGRTGRLFAGDYLNEKADIICLSKGLTGGTMALGVTACTQKIVDAFMSKEKTKTFFHGHSFTANPLACAAALASLDLLQDKVCRDAISFIASRNAAFVQRLKGFPVVRNPRSIGTVLAFEYISGEDGYLNSISSEVTAHMLKRGIYLRPLGNTIYWMPPYCISEHQLQSIEDELLAFIGKA